MVLLKFILDDWLDAPGEEKQNYTFYGACIGLFFFYSWSKAYSTYLAKTVGLYLIKGVNGVLLNKVLCLSHKSLSDCTQGKLLSLIAQDTEYVAEQYYLMLDYKAGIFGIFSCTIILLYFINFVALVGLVFMLTSLVLALFFQSLRRRILQREEVF